MSVPAPSRRLPGRLLALTPGTLAAEELRGFRARVEAAVGAGLDSILLREPEMSDRATMELARALRELLGRSGWLAIHDRVHLAPEAGADAVHLGWSSLRPAEARAILPEHVAIGLSAHAHDDPASWSAADYLVFGPVLDTSSKRGLLEPTGFDGLACAVTATDRPIWALGGMQPEHVANVREAGASGIACRAAVLAQSEPADPVRAFLRRTAAAWC